MEPAHALAFLVIALNHADTKRKAAAPDANARERELSRLMQAEGREPPLVVESAASLPAKDRRAYRVLLALWVIGEIWQLAEEDLDSGQEMRDAILGRDGLVGLWLEGDDSRTGISSQVEDISSDIVNALRERFAAYLSRRPAMPFDARDSKCCILCNEPVDSARRVNTASRAHGIKASAFSGATDAMTTWLLHPVIPICVRSALPSCNCAKTHRTSSEEAVTCRPSSPRR